MTATYPTPKEITAMSLTDLRKLATSLGISGASKLNKVTVTGQITAAIRDAKQAAKDARDAAAAAKIAQAEQATAMIAEIEADMATTRDAAVVNLETLATDFVKIYPYAPWKVRGYGTDAAAVTRYYTKQGVSKEEDSLTFPTVIRQAVSVAMWSGSAMADSVPVKVREMAFRMLGTDDAPAVAPNAPVVNVVAMTGSSTPTIARDRVALGLASETRSAANTGKHDSDTDSDTPDGTVPVAGNARQVMSIPEMLANMTQDELRMLISLATEELNSREDSEPAAA